jgi:hypothetical protein
VDDVVAWLQTKETLLAGLTDVERRSNFDATLVFDEDSAAAAVAGAVRDGDVPAPMRAALAQLDAEDRKVHIRFTQVEPVALEDLGEGHLSACILHTGAVKR